MSVLRSAVRRCVVVVLSVVAGTASLSAATAAPSAHKATCTGSKHSPAPPDFNGDKVADYVIGLPGARHGVGGVEAVVTGSKPRVYVPGAGGIPSMPSGAHFGSMTSAADINGDRCTDLLVGVPDLPVDGHHQAGGAQVLFGSPQGFSAGPLITASDTGLTEPEAHAHFGTSVAWEPAVEWEGGIVTVGVPGATVMGGPHDATAFRQAGKVVTFAVTPSAAPDPSSDTDHVTTMRDGPQTGAHFGTIATNLGTTAPDADHGRRVDTGYVQVGSGTAYGLAANEHLGASIARGPTTPKVFEDKATGLVVGAPGLRVAGHRNAGGVEQFDVADGDDLLYRSTITQAHHGVPGRPRTGARFGAALASAAAKLRAKGVKVVVGAPGRRVSRRKDAGAIYVDRFAPTGQDGYVSTGWKATTQATKGVPGQPRAHAEFGSSMATITDDDQSPENVRFFFGAPGYHNKGAVAALRLGARGITTKNAALIDRAGGGHRGDRFGAWLE